MKLHALRYRSKKMLFSPTKTMSCYSDCLSCTEIAFPACGTVFSTHSYIKAKTYSLYQFEIKVISTKVPQKVYLQKCEHATVLHNKLFLTSDSINSRSVAGI